MAFAQENQSLVNAVGSSLWNDSCMRRVPALVATKVRSIAAFSSSVRAVRPSTASPMGQIVSLGVCGLP